MNKNSIATKIARLFQVQILSDVFPPQKIKMPELESPIRNRPGWSTDFEDY